VEPAEKQLDLLLREVDTPIVRRTTETDQRETTRPAWSTEVLTLPRFGDETGEKKITA